MNLSKREQVLYGLLWIFVAWIVFSVTVWFSNWEAIIWMLGQSHVSTGDKLGFLFSYYGSLKTNFHYISAISTILVSVLFALTVTLFVHYVRIMRGVGDVETVGATGIGGLISGFFGIGCSSCGSILVVTLLGQFGAGSLLLLLPFGGQEFSFIAIALLGYSSYLLLKKIRGPKVCEIE